METATFTHAGSHGYLTDKRESHWLPALRPNTGEDFDAEVLQPFISSSILPSLSDHDSTIEESLNDSSATDALSIQQNVINERDDDVLAVNHLLDQVQRSTSFPAPRGQSMDEAPAVNIDDAPASFEQVFGSTENLHDDALIIADQSTIEKDVVQQVLGGQILEAQMPSMKTEEREGSLDERFEEGIPLLSAEQDEDETIESPTRDSNVDYVSQMIAIDATTSGPEAPLSTEVDRSAPSLDRKSTTDVLDSLGFLETDEVDSSNDFLQQLARKPEEIETQLVPEQAITKTDDKWAAAFGDEDEFLVEDMDMDDLLPDSEPSSPSSSSFVALIQQDTNGTPIPNEPQHQPRSSSVSGYNPYAPHQPSTTALGSLPSNSFQAQVQPPQLVQRAESFADQAKGGYKSPYDLPLDISKSRKKPQPSRAVSQPQRGPAPPPRSSSALTSQQPPVLPGATTVLGTNANNASSVSLPTPLSNSVGQGAGFASHRATSSSAFFEELPVVAKQRAPTNPARYTPVPSSISMPPPQPMPSSLPQPVVASNLAQPATSDPSMQFQLRQPDKIDPYANVALQAPPTGQPAPSSRYSPAPGSLNGPPKPTPSPRYSPAPPAQPSSSTSRYVSQPTGAPPPSAASNRYVSQPVSTPPVGFPPVNPALAHQPRTSSPLANQHRPIVEQTNIMPPPPLPRTNSSRPSSPPKLEPSSVSATLPQTSAFSPERVLGQPDQTLATPPQRSQTQSPSRQADRRPAFPNSTRESMERPASAFGTMSPTASSTAYGLSQPTIPKSASRLPDIDFVRPQDETAADPLERWKGAPLFRFGFGGQVVTSFPSRAPRFSSGLLRPQMKTGPGEVKIQKSSDMSTLSIAVTSFPGPLRAKSKKKDVLSWLSTTINRLEENAPSFLGLAPVLPDPRKRHEEKVLLWKMIKVLVEFDGQFEGNADALKAINVIITPEVHAIDESTASQYTSENPDAGTYRPRGASTRVEPVDPIAVESLRKHLLKGNRQDAVWNAVDNRLWSHALLIASTLDQSVWKQVVQEFVRQEVKTSGNNAESLAALYEIFGGNMADSIDQLVPPSARAGLQMVSRVDSAGPVKNALDGLDKWKETLALVLNNRCKDDYNALLALAKLLNDYGRVEAAHICLLFARNPAFPVILGGMDDPKASAVLLGSNHQTLPTEIQNDDDALVLTEVYEFAICILAGSSAATPFSHLAPYKLQRAKLLADNGLKTEAQAYCDAVAAGLKSTTKVSPYYHPILLDELDQLSNRLKQVPVQSNSWMSKPSIEKVSGSIFSKFTNFVAGDDSDAASQTSGRDTQGVDVGPFANVAGSPNLSRSGSQSDLFGSYPATTPAAISTTATGNKYAPNGILSARSSSEFGRGRPSLDSQRSPPGTSHGQDPRSSIYSPLGQTSHTQSPARSMSTFQPLGTSPNRQFGTSPALSNYQATPPQSSYMPNNGYQQTESTQDEQQTTEYVPTVTNDTATHASSAPGGQTNFGGYLPVQNNFNQSPYGVDPPAPGPEEVQAYGYEPPSDTGYVPYQPEPDSDDGNNNGKKSGKKSFMDDDGGNFPHISNSTHTSGPSGSATQNDATRRRANDDAADAAFRAAAEADAQRAKDAAAAKKSGGWFGGWLGGGKKGGADGTSLDSAKSPSSASDSKVYKANLGENKMKLYYDKDLKKWINPDDPDAGKSKGATPPPPRIGGAGTPAPPPINLPPRGPGSAPPPSVGGLSRSNTPLNGMHPPNTSDGSIPTLPPNVNTSLGFTNGLTPSPGGLSATPLSAVSSGPPSSRPPTSALTPTNNPYDDLLGPPTGAKKSARGAKKAKGRYVDIMAQ